MKERFNQKGSMIISECITTQRWTNLIFHCRPHFPRHWIPPTRFTPARRLHPPDGLVGSPTPKTKLEYCIKVLGTHFSNPVSQVSYIESEDGLLHLIRTSSASTTLEQVFVGCSCEILEGVVDTLTDKADFWMLLRNSSLPYFRVFSTTHNDINVISPEANRIVLSLV